VGFSDKFEVDNSPFIQILGLLFVFALYVGFCQIFSEVLRLRYHLGVKVWEAIDNFLVQIWLGLKPVKLTNDVKQRKQKISNNDVQQNNGLQNKENGAGSYNEVNLKFDIQIVDVSLKALSHNFLLSAFQSLERSFGLEKIF